MIYNKPALTFEQQADQLIARGLVADRAVLIQRLSSVNYYRLSGYLHTFRALDAQGNRLDAYYPGTSFAAVWERYRFDRQLRFLVLDAVERFEVSLKTQLTQRLTLRSGAFGHLNSANLPRLSAEKHAEFVERVREETERSRVEFVKHFFDKYGDNHQDLPLWMSVEVMSFGTALSLFNGMSFAELKTIASHYGVPLPVLESWVVALNGIRNICAHHGRLWNRELGAKPIIPRADWDPNWTSPVAMANNRVFAILTVLKFLLDRIAPQSEWHLRLRALLDAHPTVPKAFMGFPENWQEHGVWR